MYVTNSILTDMGNVNYILVERWFKCEARQQVHGCCVYMQAQNVIVSDIPVNCSDTQVGETDATHITSGCRGMSDSSIAKP